MLRCNEFEPSKGQAPFRRLPLWVKSRYLARVRAQVRFWPEGEERSASLNGCFRETSGAFLTQLVGPLLTHTGRSACRTILLSGV